MTVHKLRMIGSELKAISDSIFRRPPPVGDAKALLVLMEASRQTGLPVDTEVMDEEHLKLAV